MWPALGCRVRQPPNRHLAAFLRLSEGAADAVEAADEADGDERENGRKGELGATSVVIVPHLESPSGFMGTLSPLYRAPSAHSQSRIRGNPHALETGFLLEPG